MVEGHAGVGKTALLTEAAAYATRTGLKVLWGRGCELERDYPFGVVLQLFQCLESRLSRSERRKVFVGGARKAQALFGGGPLAQAEESDFPLVHGLYSLAENLAEYGPLLICVDDVQWGDLPSLRFLHYLAYRLEQLPTALLLAIRPGQPETPQDLITGLTRAPMARELSLSPLSASAADQLVRSRLPTADKRFRRACRRATQGNPFLLCELLAALESRGIVPTGDTSSQVAELAPRSVIQWTLLRLQRLPLGSLKLACAVAVLGQNARLSTATALAGLKPEVAAHCADMLWATDVLHAGEPLRFVHPLLRSSVYAQVPPAELAGAHRMAARLLASEGAGPGVIGRHLLAAWGEHDGWAVEALREAAAEALAWGAPRSAIGFLKRALAEPPHADLRAQVLVDLGAAEALVGAPQAHGRLTEALELTDDGGDKIEILRHLGWISYKQGRLAEAADIFERGLQELGGGDQALGDELSAGYLAATLMERTRAPEAEAQAERMIASTDAGSASAGRHLLSVGITWRLFKGERFTEIVARAQRVLAEANLFEHEAPESMTLWHAVACLSWSDALELSERSCSTALQTARRRGSLLMMAQAYFARSWPRYWMGQISQAAADARAAVDAWSGAFGMYLPAAAHWLALAYIELDELEQAAAVLDLRTAEKRWLATGWYAQLLMGRGRLAMARGDFKAGLNDLLAAGESLKPVTTNPAVLPWRSDAAVAADRIGNRGLAHELAEEEIRLARGFGAPRPIGVALRAAGLVQGGEAGIELLREGVATLERSPAKLELLRILVDLGAALRRAGHRRDAREILRRGLEMAERLGARALDRRARDELLASGARPRRRALSGADSLTATERRVAEMVARGLTNREIADALFVTRKAIRFHLGNVYRKLGTSSREALPAALGRHPG